MYYTALEYNTEKTPSKPNFVMCLVYPMLPVSLDCLFLISPCGFLQRFHTCDQLLCLEQTGVQLIQVKLKIKCLTLMLYLKFGLYIGLRFIKVQTVLVFTYMQHGLCILLKHKILLTIRNNHQIQILTSYMYVIQDVLQSGLLS